jgi:hypothetical protein
MYFAQSVFVVKASTTRFNIVKYVDGLKSSILH